jgi:hypothetical protein
MALCTGVILLTNAWVKLVFIGWCHCFSVDSGLPQNSSMDPKLIEWANALELDNITLEKVPDLISSGF